MIKKAWALLFLAALLTVSVISFIKMIAIEPVQLMFAVVFGCALMLAGATLAFGVIYFIGKYLWNGITWSVKTLKGNG